VIDTETRMKEPFKTELNVVCTGSFLDDGIDAAYVYARGRWKVPVLALPTPKVGCPGAT
jgi:hypothetical protein